MKTLSLLLCSLFCLQLVLANTSNCDNIDNPGRIYHNQSSHAIVKFCDAWQPAPINETLPASGGSGGAIQYQWQYQRENSDWTDISIPEGQGHSLNLGQSTVVQYLNNNGVSNSQTVTFRRGAHRPDCITYEYSNEVMYQVYPNVSDDVDAIQGGIFCDYPSDEHCLSIGLGNASETYEFLWRFSYDNENWIHTSTEVPANYCYPSGTTAYISAGSRLIGSPCDYIFKPSLEVITYRSPELKMEIIPVSCLEENDGEILVSDNSGNSTPLTDLYTFSIDQGQSWQSNPRFTGLTAGNYTIQVQTQHCNSYSISTTLTSASSPELDDVEVQHASDCGSQDGSLNIYLTGGTGVFEYRLSTTPWQNSPNFENLSPGNYGLYARNQDGSCEADLGSSNIQGPTSPTLSHVSVSPPSDCGLNNGQIQIQASGGQGTLSYTIDDGTNWSNSTVFNSLSAGQYEAGVRNQDGTCELYQSVTLDAPTSPIIESVSSQDPSNCGSSDGQISIQADGQGSSLQYTVDGGVSWSTQNSFTGLTAGFYEIRVRKSDGTCVVNHASLVELSAPSSPEISTIQVDQPSNCQVNDGEIRIYPSSSEMGYSIDGGNTWQEGSGIFSGLGPGSFEPYVRNGDGTCPTAIGAAIELHYPNQPTIVAIDYGNPTDWCITDGYLSIDATGGEGPLEYTRNGVIWQSSPDFSNGLGAALLSPGVRNTDGSCEFFFPETILIDYPDRPTIEQVTDTPDSGCGANDGSIFIEATDGIGDFDYSIDGGNSWQNSPVFADLPSGNYDIAVRNKEGSCNITDDIYVPTLLKPRIKDIEIQPPSDCSLADASIRITGDRGTGDFQFTIDAGQTWSSNNLFTGLAPGDYWLGIRNLTGYCEEYETAAVTISERSHKVITEVGLKQPSDCNIDDGEITLYAQGVGVSEYSIDGGNSWQSNRTFRDLAPGAYEPSVRNTDGTCEKLYGQIFILSYPPRPVFEDVIAEATSDCDVSDGSIEVFAGAGIGSFQYSINDGNSWQNSSVFTGLQASTYGKLAIRNSDGTCFEEYDGSVQVTQPPKPTFAEKDIEQPSDCYLDDGRIQITADDGIGSYQYTFDGGSSWQTPNELKDLEPGFYALGIRNSDGTCPIYDNGPTQLAYPPEPSIADVDFEQPSDCNTNDGSINIQAANGTGNFQFSIDGGNSWKNNGNFNSLQPGAYEVAVRNSNGTCLILDNQTIQLEYPPEPAIADVDFDHPSDCNTNDGSINIQANSGTSNFQYSIDGGNSWKNNGSFNSLQPGAYEIAVRNSNGTCLILDNQTIQLEYPPEPAIEDVDLEQPSDCGVNDGSITISGANGMGSFSFSINGGNSWQSSNTFDNIDPGTYQIGIANADGTCEIFAGNVTEIAYPDAPEIIDVIDQSPAGCGSSDGYIEVVTVGGSEVTNYSIDNGSSWTNNNKFTNLAPGVYTIKVRNQNQTCEQIYGEVQLNAPSSPAFSNLEQRSPSDCGLNNGQIIISATEGTGSYEYSIDGGQNWKNNGTFNDLAAGDYTPSIRNGNGTCQVDYQGSVTLEAPEPAEINGVRAEQPSDCGLDDGRIEVLIDQEVAEFQFSIDGGNNWQNSPVFTNLGPSSYQVGVRKNTGQCEVIADEIHQFNYPETPEITSITQEDVSDCGMQDGKLQISAQGGIGNFEYSINNGQSWLANSLFSNLAAGSYTVGVRNKDQSCPIFADAPINIAEPIAPTLDNIDISQPTDCGAADGQIQIQATGNGGTNLNFSIDGGNTWQASPTFNNLSTNSYQVAIRNADGTCESLASELAILVEPVPASFQFVNHRDPTNCEDNDGSISIALVGTTNNRRFSIDGGQSWQSAPFFNELPPGNYRIMVSNSDGTCVIEYGNQIQLEAPSAPSILAVHVQQVSDCEVFDAEIQVNALAGSSPIQYSIDNGITWRSNSTFSNLSPGVYQVVVSNENGTCPVQYAETIVIAPLIPPEILQVFLESPSNCGVTDGKLEIEAEGFGQQLLYSVDGGTTWKNAAQFEQLAPGQYSIAVKYTNGTCQVRLPQAVSITAPEAPRILNVFAEAASSCSNPSGSIQITTFPAAGIEFSIDGGSSWSSQSSYDDLAPGSYQVSIRLSDGSCQVDALEAIQISAPAAPELQDVIVDQPSDCGSADAKIQIAAIGTAPLQYSIDGGVSWSTESVFENLSPGQYRIGLQNADGECTLLLDQFLQIIPTSAPEVVDISVQAISDCERQDGEIRIEALGEKEIEYSLDNGLTWQPNSTFTGLAPGEYFLSIRYVDGSCTIERIETIQITRPIAPIISDIQTEIATDCESQNASLEILSNQPEEDLLYSIDEGDSWHTSPIFNNLAPGEYLISIRYVNGSCQVDALEAVSIEAPTAPKLTGIEEIQPTNCSSPTGQLIINSLAARTVEYSIDGGENWSLDSVFVDLPVGSYQVSIRYSDGTCQVNANAPSKIEVVESIAITDVIVHQPSTCDSSQGSITIFSNVSAEAEYSIDGGENWTIESSFQGLSVGAYSIATRLIGSNCQTTWPDTVSIQEHNDVVFAMADLEVQNSTQCQLSSGSVNILTDQTHLLFSINNGEQWQNSPLFSQLAIGAYSILAQDTISGCTGTIGNFTISGGTTPQIENVGIILPSNCTSEDGGIFINPVDQNLLYSIDAGQNWQAGHQFSGLNPGIYFVAVSSQDRSCQTDYEIPVRLSAQNAATIWQVNASLPTGCGEADASLQVTILEDESLFEFSIDNGESWQDTSLFTNLPSGSYQVKVRNKEVGCLSIYYPPVVIPNPPVYDNLRIQEQLPSFCGAQDGSILINYTNSSFGLEAYSIDGGVSWQPTALFDSLAGGIYDVRIKLLDATCELAHLFPIDLSFISSADSLQIEALGVTNCQGNDGSIRIYPPDEGNFEFSIDRGQHYQSSPAFMDLAPGNYLVRMRDVIHQCEYEHPIAVEVPSISPPLILGVQFTSPANCSQSGSIIINAAPADHLEYSIDAGASWQKDSLFTPLPAGDYQVAIRYSNGSCSISYPEVIILQDSPTTSVTEVYWEQTLCIGDSLHIGDSTIIAAGNYQINIQGENTCDSLIHLSVSTNESFVNQLDITICEGEAYELGGRYYSEAGSYQETLQSVHGCDSTINLQLSVNQVDTTILSIHLCEGENFQYANESLLEPGNYTFSHQGTWGCDSIVRIDLAYIPGPPTTEWQVETPSNCEAMDGSIQIVNSSPFLLYSIDNGLSWQNQGNFPNLGNGTYQLSVRDIQTNCIRQEEVAVLSSALPQVDTISVFPGLACEGVNGEISFHMIDGGPSYLYSIDAGQTWQEDPNFTNLGAGVYDLYVSQLDSSCAFYIQHTEIYASDSLQIEVQTIDYDHCQADSTGVIGVYVAQGSSPYDYNWSNGGSLPEIDQLPPGDYTLTVTDNKGCQDSLSVHISDPTGIFLTDSLFQDTFYLCKGEVLDLTMPEDDLRYSWRSTTGFSAEGNEVQIDAGGQYALTAISLDGCAVTDSFIVQQGTDHFHANFLLPDVGLINTSLFAVEVSWPIPNWVNWVTDDENVHQLSTYLNQTEFQFTAAGTYGLKMEAQLGDCIQETEKFITIYTDPDSLPANSGPITGGSILDFSLFPNPNNGNFELLAEFTAIQAGQMRIYNDMGVLIEARDLHGWASYRESFQLPTPVAGNYIAVLQTQYDHRTLNFIIQR